MAKKKASARRKKATAKKTGSKASRKKTAKKASRKKAGSKKKTSRKSVAKTASKRKTAKKKATKKKTAKKKPTRKKIAKKKASRKKTAKKVAKKKTTTKKTAKKKPALKKVAKKAAKKKTTTKNSSSKAAEAKKKVDRKKAAKRRADARARKGKAARKKMSKASFSNGKKSQASPRDEIVERSHGSEPIDLHHRVLSKKEVEELRNLLVKRLLQLTDDVEHMNQTAFSDSKSGVSGNHLADSSSGQYDQDFTLQMIETESEEIGAIQLALAKIDGKVDMEYGRCEDTGEWISIERLRAKPYARLSITAIERFEREGGGERYGIHPEPRI